MGLHAKQKKHLAAEEMLKQLRQFFEKITPLKADSRGVKPQISIADFLMSGLA